MDILAIFGLQVIFSILLWGLIAKWLFVPYLNNISNKQALFWLTLPHAFRHVGMVFLIPGIVAENLPQSFAFTTAYGDLTSAILAIFVLFALRANWKNTVALLWIFNIIGSVDLLFALSHPEAVPYLEGAWYIPTFFVPLLLVTHFMIFIRLIKNKTP